MSCRILLITILLALNFVGCGSKKSASNTNSPVEQSGYAVTLSGIVDSGKNRPDIKVVFSVGDKIFTTKTDTNGMYRIRLEVDKAQAQLPVRVKAEIDVLRPNFVLINVLGSVGELMRQAGPDQILTNIEDSRINLSFLSTAVYGGLLEVDDWGVDTKLDADSKLVSYLSNLRIDKALKTAAVLYLEFNGSGFDIPPINDSLEFVRGYDYDDVYEAVYRKDAKIVDKVESELGSKFNLWSAPEIVPGEYLIYMQGGRPFYKIKLNADNTGLFDADLPFRWRAVLTDASPAIEFEFDYGDTSVLSAVGQELSMSGVKTATLRFAGRGLGAARAQFMFYNYSSGEPRPVRRGEIYGFDTADCEFHALAKGTTLKPTSLDGEWFQYGENSHILKMQFKPEAQVIVEQLHGDTRYFNHSDQQAPRQKSAVIEENSLVLRGVYLGWNTTETYWLLEDLGVGYSYLKLTEELQDSDEGRNYNYSVDKGIMIRRQSNLALTKDELVGVWLDNSSLFRVVDELNVRSVDSVSRIGIWDLDAMVNTWTESIYEPLPSGSSQCNLSPIDIAQCQLKYFSKNELIAKSSDRLYFLRQSSQVAAVEENLNITEAQLNPVDGVIHYDFIEAKRLPRVSKFGRALLIAGSRFYRSSMLSNEMWSFSRRELSIYKLASGDAPAVPYVSAYQIDGNKIHYFMDGVAREILLIAIDKNGIKACDYTAGSACNSGGEFYLYFSSP